MAKNSKLKQKTVYLNEEIDKDIIKLLDSKRNISDFLRELLYREIRINNGEIALIDIKNKEILNNIQSSNISTNNIKQSNFGNDDIENSKGKANNNKEKQQSNKESDNENLASKEDISNFLSSLK